MVSSIKNFIGCDVVKISRMKKVLRSKNLVKKIFHPSEVIVYDPQHLAGIFALKEATMKALGLRSNQWLDIEVYYADSGKPHIRVAGTMAKNISMDCSISHDGDYAFAVISGLKNK